MKFVLLSSIIVIAFLTYGVVSKPSASVLPDEKINAFVRSEPTAIGPVSIVKLSQSATKKNPAKASEKKPSQEDLPPHPDKWRSGADLPRPKLGAALDRSQVESGNSSFLDNIAQAGLNPESFKGWFDRGEPAAINYWRAGELIKIAGSQSSGVGNGAGKILSLSDQRSVQETLRQREQSFELGRDHHIYQGGSYSQVNRPGQDKKPSAKTNELKADSYEIVSFTPGLRDDGRTSVTPAGEPSNSILGPDHHYEKIDPADTRALQRLRARTLSLGHGGEIVLQVKQGGFIVNQPGPDFIIYENPFYVDDGLLYQELAHVGVSEVNEAQAYTWFKCEPSRNILIGCAGLVPTIEGGDAFDLSALNLEKIRYIKIRDIGDNFNNLGANTEGFDLDALKLLHREAKPE